MQVTKLTAQYCADILRTKLSCLDYPLMDRAGRVKAYGVPRGGMCALLNFLGHSNLIGKARHVCIETHPGDADVIIDDIIDSGAIRDRFKQQHPNKPFVAIVDRVAGDNLDDGWIQFPWESETGPEDAVVRLLEFIGENPKREGLVDTPKRVLKALDEMTKGRNENPGEILGRVFEEKYDELIISRGISFTSLCEHHMLPFTGTADVGYLPGRATIRFKSGEDTYRIVGLSKLARLVDCFARRLQVQERMTSQIANAINEHLNPGGVGVVVRAEHSCQACRGIKKSGTEMVTSVFLGVLRSDQAARSEFLSLCNGGR